MSKNTKTTKMIINGQKLRSASFLQAQGVRDTETPIDIQVEITRLMNTGKYLTFLWKQLRGKRIRGEYKNFQFSTDLTAVRTVVMLIWEPSGTDGRYVHYVGISEGYSAIIDDCEIDHSAVKKFESELKEFTENFDTIEITEDD